MRLLAGQIISGTLHEDIDTQVLRGHSEEFGAVILKTTHDEAPEPRLVEELRREYALMSRLDCPGVPRALALRDNARSVVLIHEDIGGIPLDEWQRRHSPAVEEVLAIALALADALACLHRHQMVHHDIKPANIVYHAASGRVQLIDFGLASQLTREQPEIEAPGQIRGTLTYMAPEQTGRLNRSVDQRADFYSLGVTLHELFTGRPPFKGRDALELVHAHLALAPPPAHELNSALPVVVSSIVLKLLAKLPEERYQSSTGLHHDLALCARQWHEQRQVEPFELGREDPTERLQISQKLYGREEPLAALLERFDRVVSSGDSEVVLVAGHAGIGKSALIAELLRPVALRRGIFITGKCDQYERGVPFAPLSQALGALLRQVLGESDAQVEAWRKRLADALGADAGALVGLVPQLRLLVSMEPSPELPPEPAKSRLQRAFQHFVAGFARPERPLVVFIDDLQWTDGGTLDLLVPWLGDATTRHVLFIGAYRDNEVQAPHPLLEALSQLEHQARGSHLIALQPLAVESVREWLADTLQVLRADAAPLAERVHAKTLGNPFFCGQFLTALHQDGLLVFRPRQRRWCWDLDALDARTFTVNVVELLALEMKGLPEVTQRALGFAALLGNEFKLTRLAAVMGREEAALEADLWPALGLGLLSRSGQRVRFLHDRMHQAAYELTPGAELAARHLQFNRFEQQTRL